MTADSIFPMHAALIVSKFHASEFPSARKGTRTASREAVHVPLPAQAGDEIREQALAF
jgi:hypothetical protein